MDEFLQNPFSLAGWLLCAAVVIWAVFALINFFKARHLLALQFEKESLILEEELHLLRETRNQVKDTQSGWEGFANFVVAKKVVHGESGICSFYLKPRDDRLQLASFRPGQHLVFRLPIEGESQEVTRRYSLSDRPGQDCYRVSIKLHEAPLDIPGAKPGLGSSYFHNELAAGGASETRSLIQVSSPAGAFDIDPFDSKPVVLIGGGVGITPMLSMFNSIIDVNETREVWLFYTVRNEAENILFDEGMLHPRISEVLQNRQNVHLYINYTKVSEAKDIPETLPFSANQLCGRLTVEGMKTILPSNNFKFFICGPEMMMDQFEEEIEAWGVPGEDILSERFQPPTKRKNGDASSASHTIKFSKSGKEVTFSEGDNTILDAAERAGVPISFDCRAGSCGQCKIAVASGKVSYNIRTNYKCPPGSCLTCSCVPEGDIVLDC